MIDELLAECAAHPDDDEARLVWGDAIGGERGELVAIQCAPRDALTPGGLAALNRRERELLARAWEWSGLAGLVHRVRFRRGFVDAIDVDAAAWIEHGERIAAAAPLMNALTIRKIDDDPHTLLQRALAVPAFSRVRAFKLVEGRGFDASRVLVGSGVLRQLVALDVRFDDDALYRLIDAGVGHIERLSLFGSGSPETVRAIGRAATKLVAFDTSVAEPGLFETGFDNLRDLTLHIQRDVEWLAMARPLANRLERFALTATSIDPRGLADFTALRVLEFHDRERPSGRLRALATHPPPNLRELRLEHRDADAVAHVAAALGPRLDVLDLRAAARIDPVSCAGDLLVDEPITRELWHAGPVARGEWRPHGFTDGPPGAPAWLVCESGDDAGQIWDVAEHERAYLGRSTSGHIIVLHDSVARRHADLRYRDGAHYIRDMLTTNGTFANGTRVDDEVAIADDTQLQLGAMLVRFFTGPGGGARASALARHLVHFDGRTGLPRGRPERVGAVLEIQSTWNRDYVAAELARRLVAAAGPDVTVTWLGSSRFGITPGNRAAELAEACSGEVTLASDEHAPASLRVVP